MFTNTTTAAWVFARAIHMMDEQNEATGETSTADTAEYKLRTLSILNILRHELFPYSDTYEAQEDGTRDVCTEIKAFTDVIDLDDVLAQGIMPYGLAAHLLLGENDSMAAFFNSRYSELVRDLAAKKSSKWEDIMPYYGGLCC